MVLPIHELVTYKITKSWGSLESVTVVGGYVERMHYSAKIGSTHFCAIKSPKSTEVLLNMYFTDFIGFRCSLFWISLTYLASVQKCVHRNPLLFTAY